MKNQETNRIDLDKPTESAGRGEGQKEDLDDSEDDRVVNENSEGPQVPPSQECDTMEQNKTRPLPPNQVRALESLATGYTVSQAAEDAGVHRSTVHRWLKSNPDFIQQLVDYEEEVMHEIRARTMDLVSSGLQTLEDILSSNCRTLTKIAALKTINIGDLMILSFAKTRKIKRPSDFGEADSGERVIPDDIENTDVEN
jgi:hypothetical protein